jgi:hypothetical protein
MKPKFRNITGKLMLSVSPASFSVVNILERSRYRGMHIGYWWEIQKERDHWEDQDVGGWTILKLILER